MPVHLLARCRHAPKFRCQFGIFYCLGIIVATQARVCDERSGQRDRHHPDPHSVKTRSEDKAGNDRLAMAVTATRDWIAPMTTPRRA